MRKGRKGTKKGQKSQLKRRLQLQSREGSNKIWAAKDEEDSDYVDQSDEGENDDSDASSNSELSDSEDGQVEAPKKSLGNSGPLFPAALLELLSYSGSLSPSLFEYFLTKRDLFLSVPNVGRDFVAKLEELILNLIQLSKLYAKSSSQLGQEVFLHVGSPLTFFLAGFWGPWF